MPWKILLLRKLLIRTPTQSQLQRKIVLEWFAAANCARISTVPLTLRSEPHRQGHPRLDGGPRLTAGSVSERKPSENKRERRPAPFAGRSALNFFNTGYTTSAYTKQYPYPPALHLQTPFRADIEISNGTHHENPTHTSTPSLIYRDRPVISYRDHAQFGEIGGIVASATFICRCYPRSHSGARRQCL